MSLPHEPIPLIPPMTRRIAQQAFPKGNVYMKMRDELGTIYKTDVFADLYPLQGQPSYSPWRLALVSIMQFAENLSDRQAADAVRARLDWKYALSLELGDSGFDYSVLSEFRQRLLAHDAGERLLDVMLTHFKAQGLLTGTGKQRSDATHVFAAVQWLNRLEFVGRSLQNALEQLSEEAPDWLKAWVEPIWFTRYGQVLSDYRLPKSKTEREALALQIGHDGWQLLETIYHDSSCPSDLRDVSAVRILRQIWVQQYVWIDGELHWRKGKELPPSHRLIKSPFDLEARYSRKRETEWVGYKVHLTETCDEQSLNLITHVQTTPATTNDVVILPDIHQALARKDLLPDEHYVDAGYMSAVDLAQAELEYDVNLMGFVREESSWQRETGYDISAFDIDWINQQVTCPQGHHSTSWIPIVDAKRTLFRVAFPKSACRTCPVHDQCTRSVKRHLTFPEQAVFEKREQRRAEQKEDTFRERYRIRSGVEGTMSEGAFVLGMRRSRYRGLDKTHLQHVMTATAMNLTRAINWLATPKKSKTRKTRFAKLQAA